MENTNCKNRYYIKQKKFKLYIGYLWFFFFFVFKRNTLKSTIIDDKSIAETDLTIDNESAINTKSQFNFKSLSHDIKPPAGINYKIDKKSSAFDTTAETDDITGKIISWRKSYYDWTKWWM